VADVDEYQYGGTKTRWLYALQDDVKLDVLNADDKKVEATVDDQERSKWRR
jgi:hypothetical protein